MEIPHRLSNRLLDYYSSRYSLFLVILDGEQKVRDIYGDGAVYGYGDIGVSDDGGRVFEFLHGFDGKEPFEIACYPTPTGRQVNVVVMPDKDSTFVSMIDISGLVDQSTAIQSSKLLVKLREAYQEADAQRSKAEEANKIKSNMLSNISHEFRTPLTSILGYTELLERIYKGEEAGTYLNAISRGANHLLSLIENILDQGRIESGQLYFQIRPTDTRSLIKDVQALFQPMALQKSIQFDVDFTGLPEFPLNIDRLRMRQVLINITGNALKYTDKGKVSVRAHWKDQRLFLSIRDSGPGIDPDDQEKIFSPFVRLKGSGQSGAGLGLSISRYIIESIGGELELESSPGQGSRFRFWIPAVRAMEDDELAQAKAAPRPALAQGENQTVLLVEDDQDISTLFEIILEHNGYQVQCVSDGAEALHIALESQPWVVLMDMHLPTLQGQEVVSRLREKGYTGRILALTASVSEAEREQAMGAGCDGFLAKPIDVDELLSSIRAAEQG